MGAARRLEAMVAEPATAAVVNPAIAMLSSPSMKEESREHTQASR